MSKHICVKVVAIVSIFHFFAIAAGPFVIDSNTVYLMHFEDNDSCARGVAPVHSENVSYGAGLFGRALRFDKSSILQYDLSSAFHPERGTVECWIKRQWTGNENLMRVFTFNAYDAMTVQFDAATLIHFQSRIVDNEIAYHNITAWTDSQWHHLAVTWEIPGFMRMYIDGVLRAETPADSLDLIGTSAPFHIGGHLPEYNVVAFLDEFRVSNRARTSEEIANSVMAATYAPNAMSLVPDTLLIYQNKSFSPWLSITSDIGLTALPSYAATWNSADTSIAVVTSDGRVIGRAAGTTTITASCGGISSQAHLTVRRVLFPPEQLEIDSFLATPAAGALWEIPVLIIEYLVPKDSVEMDWHVPWETITIDDIKTRLYHYRRRVKFMVEEGSRYHGYKDSTALPSLGYKVVGIHRFYEPQPISRIECGWNPNHYYPDYHEIFRSVDAQRYIEELGVKEVWIWGRGGRYNGIEYERPESNMSSPTTGDISNSARLRSDLPIYKHTYIVYDFPWDGTHGNALHNIGHQTESMLTYVNTKQDGNHDLFIKKFCGYDTNWTVGRCGWTHMPPNTDQHYIYDDTTIVLSDCEDWRPNGSGGRKKPVNVNTWRSIPYAYPPEMEGWTPESSPYHLNFSKTDGNFYLYWRQNIPGRGANIPYESSKEVTNWWQFFGAWDSSITANVGLWRNLHTTGQEIANGCAQKPFRMHISGNRISYYLTSRSDLNIDIVNISGRIVYSHKQAGVEPGYYHVDWNDHSRAGRLSNGCYIVSSRLRTGSISMTDKKKMILVQ